MLEHIDQQLALPSIILIHAYNHRHISSCIQSSLDLKLQEWRTDIWASSSLRPFNTLRACRILRRRLLDTCGLSIWRSLWITANEKSRFDFKKMKECSSRLGLMRSLVKHFNQELWSESELILSHQLYALTTSIVVRSVDVLLKTGQEEQALLI